MTSLIQATVGELDKLLSEEAKKPSLGKLAADHAEAHQATEEDGEDDKRPAIEAKITKHYGQETTDAVKKHSEDVNAVENSSGPGGVEKNFHGNFVKTHLGGHGSAEHKAYQEQMRKHGHEESPHQTDPEWDNDSVKKEEVEPVNEISGELAGQVAAKRNDQFAANPNQQTYNKSKKAIGSAVKRGGGATFLKV